MRTILAAAVALMIAAPAAAKWSIAPSGRTSVAASSLSVEPGAGWNRWSKHPLKHEELWSLDGPLLNRLDFLGGIAAGEPLAREANRKREPLPKFESGMKAVDVAELVERTVRITEQAPDYTTEAVDPATFAGKPGFRIRYRYTTGELVRRGEARGAVVDGRLYLIRFAAPALYYFDLGLPAATAVIDSARIG